MNQHNLLKNLDGVDKIASLSKLGRLIYNPFKYIHAIFFREFIYKKKKQSKEVIATTFFEEKMYILLPASTDIYLTKGKSHDSEIRLAKFIIKQLKEGDTFVDVGAHYGYFTLLAATIVKAPGKVFSFEASPTNFGILKKNTLGKSNIILTNKAVSAKKGNIEFYEFPNLYAEYNSMDVSQFEKEAWFQKIKPRKINIEAIELSTVFEAQSLKPAIIKIDVEGAELKVIKGLKIHAQQHAPAIVMEYLCTKRNNIEHQKAASLLQSLSYNPFIIDYNGILQACPNIDAHIDNHQLESDNIVFIKQT